MALPTSPDIVSGTREHLSLFLRRDLLAPYAFGLRYGIDVPSLSGPVRRFVFETGYFPESLYWGDGGRKHDLCFEVEERVPFFMGLTRGIRREAYSKEINCTGDDLKRELWRYHVESIQNYLKQYY